MILSACHPTKDRNKFTLTKEDIIQVIDDCGAKGVVEVHVETIERIPVLDAVLEREKLEFRLHGQGRFFGRLNLQKLISACYDSDDFLTGQIDNGYIGWSLTDALPMEHPNEALVNCLTLFDDEGALEIVGKLIEKYMKQAPMAKETKEVSA
jgi:hypothetical protein